MNYVIIFSQILLALYFVIGAAIDIWHRQLGLELMTLKKIPWPKFLYFGAVALKLLAGLAVMFNIYGGIGALVLAIFTLIANIIFNDFWKEQAIKRQFALSRFLCNLAVIGGLLLVVVIHYSAYYYP